MWQLTEFNLFQFGAYYKKMPNTGCKANGQYVNNHHTNNQLHCHVHRIPRIVGSAEQIIITPAEASKAVLSTMTLCLMAERSNIK